MIRTRIPAPLLALGLGALMWWLDRHVPGLRLLGRPWNRTGWLLLVPGTLADVIALATFFHEGTTVNPVRVDRASRLVVSGLYRASRNPMYLGLLMVLAGWALLLGSLSPWLAVVAFERLTVVLQIKPEEAALSARFPAEYPQYMRQVNRWFGRARH